MFHGQLSIIIEYFFWSDTRHNCYRPWGIAAFELQGAHTYGSSPPTSNALSMLVRHCGHSRFLASHSSMHAGGARAAGKAGGVGWGRRGL
jgi:hypothetical protein